MIELILWILGVSIFTLFGAWYARKFNSPDALIGLYVAFVTLSNLAASKIAAFDLGFTTFFATAATLVFGVTFLLTDIVNEKFGRKETQKMIFIAFLTQVAMSLFIWIIISIPSAPFWPNQQIFEQLFGLVPRIILASWIAFLISENFDAYIFAWFKDFTKGKHLWARNVFSSFPTMIIDSVLFVSIAFYGIQPIVPIIIGQVAIKWLVGIVDIPFMYLNRWIMYRQ